MLSGVRSGCVLVLALELLAAAPGKLPGMFSEAAELPPAENVGTGEPSLLPDPWNARAFEDLEDEEEGV